MATVPEKHVAVFAFSFASHPFLLLNLARRLASATPTVVFSFFNTPKSNRALFHEPSCHNIRPFDVASGKPEDDVKLFLTVADEEFRKGVKVAEEDIGLEVSCLLGDAFLCFAGEMAEEMNVPWVAFWAAGTNSLSIHLHTDLIRQKGAQLKAEPDAEIVDLIPGFSRIRVGDLPSGVLSGNLESPFATMLHKIRRTLPKAMAVPINSFQELDPRITKDLSSKLNNFLNIGPFNLVSKPKTPTKVDEFSCISWLDSQKPRSVAYISFGTMCMPPPHELVELAKALDETNTPFLWSIDNNSKTHLPRDFLEKRSGEGKVVPWAPQVQVLEHVAIRVHVTHSGWNSVLESLGAGVPMICRPFFADNHINASMVENVWGIGMKIEGGIFTKHGTHCALEKVSQNMGAMMERIAALKEFAREAVRPDGSSDRNFKTLVNIITRATL